MSKTKQSDNPGKQPSHSLIGRQSPKTDKFNNVYTMNW